VKDLGAFLPFVAIALLFWLLIIRPQRKRAHELSAVQRGLVPGTEVMLGSGIFGRVVAVADDSLSLEVAPGTVVKVARQAVVRVVELVEPDDPVARADGEEPAGPTDQPGKLEQ
jgi:preprotein translocase subunit YajC